MNLVEDVYRLTQSFPRHELYGLSRQMQRAAVSLPSNIAESHTRAQTTEFLNHSSIAQASVANLQSQPQISARLGYASRGQVDLLMERATVGRKQLSSLRNALLKRTGATSTASIPYSS